MYRLRGLVLLALLPLLAVPSAHGQRKKKADPKDPPRILMSLPLGVKPGTTGKLTLRGLKLDTAKAVRCEPKGTAKVLQKKKVGVNPQQEASKVGDSEVEVELTVPGDVSGDELKLIAETPGGATAPYALSLDRTPPVAEKEPNNSFKEAQAVTLGTAVQGTIGFPMDVDVYRFEGKVGQQVVIEVLAARRGSALDSYLTVYNDKGQLLDTCDDLEGSTDSRVELTLPRDGTYFATLVDAHDQAGPTHLYRIVFRVK